MLYISDLNLDKKVSNDDVILEDFESHFTKITEQAFNFETLCQ